jgi:hypothetical protein
VSARPARKALFRDGLPADLPAAALDALEWLDWLAGELTRPAYLRPEYRGLHERLARCAGELRRRLGPHLPGRYEGAADGEAWRDD